MTTISCFSVEHCDKLVHTLIYSACVRRLLIKLLPLNLVRNRHLPVCQSPLEKAYPVALTKDEIKLRYLKTELVAQVEFTEWTPDNHLRHSKFIGLREDKEAMEI